MLVSEVGKLVYEKPVIQFWSASELDAIQAAMSGCGASWPGGGSSSGGGESGGDPLVGTHYEWDAEERRSEFSNDVASFVASFVSNLIVDVATKNLKLGLVAGAAVGAIVDTIVTNCIGKIYYVVHEWYLWEMPNNPVYLGGVVGHFVATEVFEDENHLLKIGSTLLAESFSSEVPDDIRDACPYYE